MEEKKSLNFFERIYYSIFKFDKYDIFINERASIATRYMLVLVLLTTLLVCTIEVFDFIKIYDRGRDYVLQNQLPEFKYKDGELSFSEKVENYDDSTKYYFYANTEEMTKAQNDEILSKTSDYKYALILFKDRAVFSLKGAYSVYKFSNYDQTLDFETLDNQGLIDVLNTLSPQKIFFMILSVETISVYIAQIIATYLNILFLFLSAIIICKIINLGLEKHSIYNISCYSITLSIILTVIYNIFYFITNIEIRNMDTVYLILAFIYLVASLFIIKQEVSKQKIEIRKNVKNIKIEKGKTVEELEKEKEEAKEETKKKEEKNEEESKKNTSDDSSKKVPNNGEPDGSEI